MPPDTLPNGRTAYLSDLNALRDWLDERMSRERAETRQDIASLEARVRDDIGALDTKLTQVVNHQSHELAAHDAAITALRERMIRLEARLWWLVVAATLGSALPGALERAIKWFGG